MDNALPDYSLTFDDADNRVSLWTRNDGKRLRRMIADVRDPAIATMDETLFTRAVKEAPA